MGRLLWIQHLIDILLEFLRSFMQYLRWTTNYNGTRLHMGPDLRYGPSSAAAPTAKLDKFPKTTLFKQGSHTFSEMKFKDFSRTFQGQNYIFQAPSDHYLVYCKYIIQ